MSEPCSRLGVNKAKTHCKHLEQVLLRDLETLELLLILDDVLGEGLECGVVTLIDDAVRALEVSARGLASHSAGLKRNLSHRSSVMPIS